MKQQEANFEFLIEYITAKIVEWIVRDQSVGIEEAMLLFHNSETFDKLCQRQTGLFVESPAYIYDIFNEELRRGTLRGLTE